MDEDTSRALSIHQLSVARAFNGLSPRERLYAHHMARAAWSGTRIILSQVSPESNAVFDPIMQLRYTQLAKISFDLTRGGFKIILPFLIVSWARGEHV